ncbi:MAG TPA: hypothetical protein VFV10_01435 [Gammaproteobacteria bacterium]|nr:hypothetical protein [Gammaproteobacteria bacterium]
MRTPMLALMSLLAACGFLDKTANEQAQYRASTIYLGREAIIVSTEYIDRYACLNAVLICEPLSMRQMRCRCPL